MDVLQADLFWYKKGIIFDSFIYGSVFLLELFLIGNFMRFIIQNNENEILKKSKYHYLSQLTLFVLVLLYCWFQMLCFILDSTLFNVLLLLHRVLLCWFDCWNIFSARSCVLPSWPRNRSWPEIDVFLRSPLWELSSGVLRMEECICGFRLPVLNSNNGCF